MSRDYYEVLGLSKDVSDDDIRKAYRRLAKKYHPDTTSLPKEEAAEKFKELNEAYETLSDPDKKADYDRYGPDGMDGAFGMGGFSNRARPRPHTSRPGEDLRYDLSIGLRKAFNGCTEHVSVPRTFDCTECNGTGARDGKTVRCMKCGGTGFVEEVVRSPFGFVRTQGGCTRCGGTGRAAEAECRNCHGRGRFTRMTDIGIGIPAGIQDGGRVRVPGMGNGGYRGGPDGDFYAVVHVEDEDGFERFDDDLATDVHASYSKLVLGGPVRIEGLDGKVIEVRIPAGTQVGTVLKVTGQGMTSVYGKRRGDLLVRVGIEIPCNVSPETAATISALEKSAKKRGRRTKKTDSLL